MSNYKELQALLKTLKHLRSLLKQAESQTLPYTQFLLEVMSYEKKRREEKLIERRLKWATFPVYKTLDEFSLVEQPSLKKIQFNQLSELVWLDQLWIISCLWRWITGKKIYSFL